MPRVRRVLRVSRVRPTPLSNPTPPGPLILLGKSGLPPKTWRVLLSCLRLVSSDLLVLDRRQQPGGAVATAGVVEVVAPGRDDRSCLGLGGESAPRKHLVAASTSRCRTRRYRRLYCQPHWLHQRPELLRPTRALTIARVCPGRSRCPRGQYSGGALPSIARLWSAPARRQRGREVSTPPWAESTTTARWAPNY